MRVIVFSVGSNSLPFDYLAPSISSISGTVPTSGGDITINGANLGLNATATVGGINCPRVGGQSHTFVRCTVPAGSGTGKSVVVTVAGQTSNALNFDYRAPIVSNLYPPTGQAGAQMTINGSSFGTAPSATIGGNVCAIVSASHTQIQCTIPAGQGTSLPVVVTSAGLSNAQSTATKFSYSTVVTPPPVISSVTFNPATNEMTVTGSNFTNLTDIKFGTTICGTTYSSPTQIRCFSNVAQGTFEVRALNAAGTSSPVSFTFAPTILEIRRPPTIPTTGGVDITMTGTDFGTSPSVTVGGAPCPVVNARNDEVTCTLPAGQGINVPVVINAPGGTNTASTTATITYERPSISTISPDFGPTTGNTPLTINGMNFGTTPSVTIGGLPCATQSVSHTQIVCTTAPAANVGPKAVVVTSAGQQNAAAVNFLFETPTPSITNVSPSVAPTSGGVELTISGKYLSNATVTIGGAPCPLTGAATASQVKCTLPPGQGANVLLIATTSFGPSTVPFSYAPPSIAGIATPNGAPTAGGVQITINGANLGTGAPSAPSVMIGAIPCAQITNQTHTSLNCLLPPGQGVNQPVILNVAGQTTQSTFSYAAPAVSTISPLTGPVAGGIELSVNGTNFGAAPTVTVGGVNCPPVAGSVTQTSLRCTLPAGLGTNRQVIVSAGGQSSSPALFNYEAATPVITNISPTSGSTAGGIEVTLTGTNFGQSPVVTFGSAITFGPAVCTPTGVATETTLRCTLPAGEGLNVQVRVQNAGAISQPGNFNYAAPSISNVAAPNGAPIIGGNEIVITGTNFGLNPNVTVGGAGCPPIAITHTSVRCTLPMGSGTNLPVVLRSVTQTANATLSYAPPAISNISPPSAAAGAEITITGTNFGTSPAVTLGGMVCSPILGGATYTSIRCTVPAGEGDNLPVVLTSAGQASAPAMFSYEFAPPLIANITPAPGPTAGGSEVTIYGANFIEPVSVTFGASVCASQVLVNNGSLHCTLPAGEGIVQVRVQSGPRIGTPVNFNYSPPAIAAISAPAGAPTAGNVDITISGSNFGLAPAATIAGRPCMLVAGTQTHTSLTCRLPPGAGISQAVIVTVGGQNSAPFFFNYAAPVITSIEPAVGSSAGGTQVSITGSNFGEAATVSFNGVVRAPAAPQSQTSYVCMTPPGMAGQVSVGMSVGNQVATTTFTYE